MWFSLVCICLSCVMVLGREMVGVVVLMLFVMGVEVVVGNVDVVVIVVNCSSVISVIWWVYVESCCMDMECL